MTIGFCPFILAFSPTFKTPPTARSAPRRYLRGPEFLVRLARFEATPLNAPIPPFNKSRLSLRKEWHPVIISHLFGPFLSISSPNMKLTILAIVLLSIITPTQANNHQFEVNTNSGHYILSDRTNIGPQISQTYPLPSPSTHLQPTHTKGNKWLRGGAVTPKTGDNHQDNTADNSHDIINSMTDCKTAECKVSQCVEIDR